MSNEVPRVKQIKYDELVAALDRLGFERPVEAATDIFAFVDYQRRTVTGQTR